MKKFKERFIDALPEVPAGLNLDEFLVFNSNLKGLDLLSEEDFKFLTEVGLPKQAPPFLSFNEYSDWNYQVSRFFPIGADGSGNNICIDSVNGEIVLLDHDFGMKSVFLNSSLNAFTECLCIYQESVSVEKFSDCLGRMLKVDDKLSDFGKWWISEIENS